MKFADILEEYSKEIPQEIRLLFKGLSDDEKMGILVALMKDGNMTFNQLKTKFNMSPSSLINHLKSLQQAGLIQNKYGKGDNNRVSSYYEATSLPKKIFTDLDRSLQNEISIRGNQPIYKVQRKNRPAIFQNEKSTFLGRHDELEMLKNYFQKQNNPITIFGIGGIGKSTLAYKAIHGCEEIFDVIIPLYFDSKLTYSDVLLEIQKYISPVSKDEFKKLSNDGKREILYESLNSLEHPLIFADNFEVVNYALNTKSSTEDKINIKRFLSNIPKHTTVLLTSRNLSNLDNEVIVPIEGLKENDGLNMFLQLAHLDESRISSTLLNSIKKFIQEVDGHPLAIEIMARNYDNSEDYFDMPLINTQKERQNPDTDLPRQQTIEACFEYSLQKLDVKIKNLLTKLTMFNSPFMIDGVISIFDAKREQLFELINRGLVNEVHQHESVTTTAKPESLYQIQPLTKIYLQKLLQNKNLVLETTYAEKFSKYYKDLLADIVISSNNGLKPFLLNNFKTMTISKINDFERALFLAVKKSDKAEIANNFGIVLSLQSKYEDALDHYKIGLLAYQEINDRMGLTLAHSNIAKIFMELGKYDEALAHIKTSIKLLDENNQDVVGKVHHVYSSILRRVGKYDEALEAAKISYKINKKLRNDNNLSKSLRELGLIYDCQGNFIDSIEHHKMALRIDEALMNDSNLSWDYNNLGVVYRKIRHLDESLDYLEKSLELNKKSDSKLRVAICYRNMGLTRIDTGEFDEALENIKTALSINRNLNNRIEFAKDYHSKGLVLAGMGYFDEALENIERSLTINRELNNEIAIARNYRDGSVILRDMGYLDEAQKYIQEALEIDIKLKNNVGQAMDYRNIAIAKRDLGCFAEAITNIEKALKINKKIKDLVWTADNTNNLGLIYRNMGKFEKAINYHKKASSIYEELSDKIGLERSHRYLCVAFRKQGNFDEAQKYINNAIKKNEERHTGKQKEDLECARNKREYSLLLRDIGKFDEAKENIENSLKSNKDVDNKIGMASCYSTLGLILRDKGELDESLENHKKALRIHNTFDQDIKIAHDYRNISIIHRDKGELSEAKENIKLSLQIHKKLRDKIGEARDCRYLGLILRDMGELGASEKNIKQAIEISESLNDNLALARDYRNLGAIYRDKGQLSKAKKSIEKSLAMNEELDDVIGLARAYNSLGMVYLQDTKLEEAKENLEKALAINIKLDDRVRLVRNYRNLSLVFRDKKMYGDAISKINEAIKLDRQLNDKIGLAKDYFELAVIHEILKEKDDTIEAASTSNRILLDLKRKTDYSHPLLDKIHKKFPSLIN